MDVIQQFVPFDAYAFLLTDPVSTGGCSPLAEIPRHAAAFDPPEVPHAGEQVDRAAHSWLRVFAADD